MAHKGHHVGAAVIFYGGLNGLDTVDVARDVRAPLMGNFGGDDQGIPIDVVQKAADTLFDLGKAVDFKIYPGAPHAFFNDTRPHIYHEAASQDAWVRTLAWFRQYVA
jgi:carboxymethylenebutenolidase